MESNRMVKQLPNQKSKKQTAAPIQAGSVDVIYYTDPLCCWSWAMEPQLRRIQYEYEHQLNWRYCMGGLLPGWHSYSDEINSVTKPIQMGPLWMHAHKESGMPIDAAVWKNDPPSSSYPGCIAVKCVGLQSPAAGIRYLRLLREAIMLHGKNISKETILIEIARELSADTRHDFNLETFKEDMKNGDGLEAFRSDMQEKQLNNISRFPTLIIKSPSTNKGVIVTGYRPYNILLDSLFLVNPLLQKTRCSIEEEEYISFWNGITRREAEEINGHH
ncbi:MAG: DsbA family protein [Bacteroidota bacterium]|nr:DsbA family protein [Bacteroidota bacterium]